MGKPPGTLGLVEESAVSLYRRVPALWAQYLGANGVAPAAISLNGYWIAQPDAERRLGIIPVPYYSVGSVLDIAASVAAETAAAIGRPCPMRVFSTPAGPSLEATRAYFADDSSAQIVWESHGFDGPDLECADATGRPILRPHELAAQLTVGAAGLLSEFRPLDSEGALTAVGGHWGV